MTPFGNVRQGPNGEALLPPGMLDDVFLRQARNGQMAIEVRLVKDLVQFSSFSLFLSVNSIQFISQTFHGLLYQNESTTSGIHNILEELHRFVPYAEKGEHRQV